MNLIFLLRFFASFTIFYSSRNMVFTVDYYSFDVKVQQLTLMDVEWNVLLTMRYKVLLLILLIPVTGIF